MYHEGWNKKSIADLLELSRQHVTRLINAFEGDGFDSLLDKRTRPINHPDNQMTFPFLEEVLAVQLEYPRAGRFRVHGLMEYFKGVFTQNFSWHELSTSGRVGCFAISGFTEIWERGQKG